MVVNPKTTELIARIKDGVVPTKPKDDKRAQRNQASRDKELGSHLSTLRKRVQRGRPDDDTQMMDEAFGDKWSSHEGLYDWIAEHSAESGPSGQDSDDEEKVPRKRRRAEGDSRGRQPPEAQEARGKKAGQSKQTMDGKARDDDGDDDDEEEEAVKRSEKKSLQTMDGKARDDDGDDDDEEEEEAVKRSEKKSLQTMGSVAGTQEEGEAEEHLLHGCGPFPSSTEHLPSVPWSCEETACTETHQVWTPRRNELVYATMIWRRPRDASLRAEQYLTSHFQLKNREAATLCCVLAASKASEGGGMAFRGFLRRELNIAVGEQEADLDDRLARAVRNSVDFLIACTDMDEAGLPQEPNKLAAAILIRGRIILASVGRGMLACARLAAQAAPCPVQDDDIAPDQASVAVYQHDEVEGYVLASEGLMGRAAEQEVWTKKKAIMKLVREGDHLPGPKEVVELGDRVAEEFIAYCLSPQLRW